MQIGIIWPPSMAREPGLSNAAHVQLLPLWSGRSTATRRWMRGPARSPSAAFLWPWRGIWGRGWCRATQRFGRCLAHGWFGHGAGRKTDNEGESEMAMTTSERQARYIQRLRAGGSDGLKARVADLERQVARLRAYNDRLVRERMLVPKGDLLALLARANREIDQLKKEVVRLRKNIKTGTWMSPALIREIRAALHPDRAVKNPARYKRLEALSKEFNGGLAK
jgi:ribosomal protein L29